MSESQAAVHHRTVAQLRATSTSHAHRPAAAAQLPAQHRRGGSTGRSLLAFSNWLAWCRRGQAMP